MYTPNSPYPACMCKVHTQQCPTGSRLFAPRFAPGYNGPHSWMRRGPNRNVLENNFSTSKAPANGLSRKGKRYRTAYTTAQISHLEEEYKRNRYIDPVRRQLVARSLNISDRNIKVWFQNRRMKEKNQAPGTSNSTPERDNTSNGSHPDMPVIPEPVMNVLSRHDDIIVPQKPSLYYGDHDYYLIDNINRSTTAQPMALAPELVNEMGHQIEPVLPDLPIPIHFFESLEISNIIEDLQELTLESQGDQRQQSMEPMGEVPLADLSWISDITFEDCFQ